MIRTAAHIINQPNHTLGPTGNHKEIRQILTSSPATPNAKHENAPLKRASLQSYVMIDRVDTVLSGGNIPNISKALPKKLVISNKHQKHVQNKPLPNSFALTGHGQSFLVSRANQTPRKEKPSSPHQVSQTKRSFPTSTQATLLSQLQLPVSFTPPYLRHLRYSHP